MKMKDTLTLKPGLIETYKGCEIHMINKGSLYFKRNGRIGFYEYDSIEELKEHINHKRGINSEAWK